MTDLVLLQRIRESDEDALDLLMERYWSDLQVFLDHLVENRDLAEDLAQETFMRLWSRRETWRLTGSLRALLFQVGRRLAFDDMKRRRRRSARLDRFRPRSAVATPADVLDRGELDRAVARAVAALPERRRTAFLMARREGRSHAEIAEVMGISVQTVANQLTTALAELRTVLRPYVGSG